MFKKLLFLLIILANGFTFAEGGMLEMGIMTETSPKALLLKDDVLDILCKFKATMIYFYFERKTSHRFASGLLSGLSECGTAFITQRNVKGYTVTIVNDDGIMMYMVLVITNSKESICLSHVKQQSGDKNMSFFIVLVEDATYISEDWLKTSFDKFWKLWILNVVIIYWENGLQIYKYSPFCPKILRKLDSNARSKNELFSQKLPNMNKNKLRVAMYPEKVRAIFNRKNIPVGGADVLLMNFFVERLNATKEMILSPDLTAGEIHENGSGDGTLALVMDKKADVSFNIAFLIPYLFEGVLENTIVLGRNDLCVLVPRRGQTTSLLNFLKPFKKLVWLMVGLVLIGAFIFLKNFIPKDFNLIFSLYASSLNMPIPKLPISRIFRVFILFWLFYSILIAGAYRANLTSCLVVPNFLPELNSLEQLADSGYKILLEKRYENHVWRYMNGSPHSAKMMKNIQLISTEIFTSRLDSNNLSYAYMDKWHLQNNRVNNKNHRKNGKVLFHLAKTCPIPFHMVYIVPQGSPYLGYLNKIIRYAEESGIILFWNKQRESRRNRRLTTAKKIYMRSPATRPKVVRFTNFKAAFFLYLGGVILAGLVFIGEIIWAKCKPKLLAKEKEQNNEVFEFVN